MASIDIITPPGTIHIELLDNPFVKKWTEHFSDMLGVYKLDYAAQTIPVYNKAGQTPEEYEQHASNLRDAINKVNALGTNFLFDPEKITVSAIRDNHDEGQKILNEVHRYFTTAGRSMQDWVSENEHISQQVRGTGYWSDHFLSNFAINEEDEEYFLHYHAKINDYVHMFDQYSCTSHIKEDIMNQIVCLQFQFDCNAKTAEGENCRFEKGTWQEITEEDWKYANDSDDDIDVWVGKDILGKNYIEAYYDQDDPTEWDVTPINGHGGKFEIAVSSQWYDESTDNTLQEFVKSERFRNWLSDWGVEYVSEMAGMPLGKVTSGKEFAIRKYFKSVYKQEFQIKVNN